jgi:adenylate cyclase
MMTLRARRRQMAIVFADVVGYSRLTEIAEEDTHDRLMRLRSEVLEPSIANYGGRLVKSYGDGFLAAFDDASSAARCAISIQKKLGRCESATPEEQRIALRMGLNYCDLIVEGDDLYGEGVNIAARLQAYADPGGIVMPARVAEEVRAHIDIASVDLGDLFLRNISKPVRAISLRGSTGEPARVGPAAEKRPSVAVLPFRTVPPEDTQIYFAEGIVEDIIRGIGGLRELFVISRASTLHYRGPMVDVRTVGAELGVRYVLQGSVRREYGHLRITTELSDAGTGTVLHTDRYDGDATDLFTLQDRIAAEVVATIAPHVRQWELSGVLRRPPDSWSAYDLLLQALNLLYRLDYESFSRARSLLQLAIENDPEYASPYAYAAQWHLFRISQGWTTDPDVDSREAARLAAQAIERDQHEAIGLALHGHALSWFFKQYDGALVFLDRAVKAGPNCAMAWTVNSLTHSYIGDGPTAVARAEHALRLSPHDPHSFYYYTNLAFAHYTKGTYAEAVTNGYRALAQGPRFCAGMRILIASLTALERVEEAREVARMLMRIQPKFRLSEYRRVCPFKGVDAVALMLDRLAKAGLPV